MTWIIVSVLVVGFVAVVVALCKSSARTDRRLELIANHLVQQQPPRKPELRVIRGGRR